jgi:hypothetical protein
MAAQDSDKSRKIVPDELVEQLGSDGAGAVLLAGWVGRGDEDGQWRLYRTPELVEWVEFSDGDVLRTEKIPTDRALSGGQMIWFRPEAKLRVVVRRSQEVQAEFLRGAVMSSLSQVSSTSLRPGTGMPPIAAIPTITVTPSLVCLDSFFNVIGLCDALTTIYPNTYDASVSCRNPAWCAAPPPPPPPPPCPGLGTFCWITWF